MKPYVMSRFSPGPVDRVLTISVISQTLRQIEDELQTSIYPGTEIMADVGSHHFVKGGGSRVLVPQPSADPNDPLVRNERKLRDTFSTNYIIPELE